MPIWCTVALIFETILLLIQMESCEACSPERIITRFFQNDIQVRTCFSGYQCPGVTFIQSKKKILSECS